MVEEFPKRDSGHKPGQPASLLGELLLSKGVISPVQLEKALEEQRRHGGRLGPTLVSLGYTTYAVIEKVAPVPMPTKLGQRLIENKVITREQLKAALGS